MQPRRVPALRGTGKRPLTRLQKVARDLNKECVRLMSALATYARIVRCDKPCGILPSPLTAKPKGRGLMPRHEWMLGG